MVSRNIPNVIVSLEIGASPNKISSVLFQCWIMFLVALTFVCGSIFITVYVKLDF